MRREALGQKEIAYLCERLGERDSGERVRGLGKRRLPCIRLCLCGNTTKRRDVNFPNWFCGRSEKERRSVFFCIHLNPAATSPSPLRLVPHGIKRVSSDLNGNGRGWLRRGEEMGEKGRRLVPIVPPSPLWCACLTQDERILWICNAFFRVAMILVVW